MSMNVAVELRDQLNAFEEYLKSLDENSGKKSDDGQLRSSTISRDDRTYYLDLKENDRGRFLRVRRWCFDSLFVRVRLFSDFNGWNWFAAGTNRSAGSRSRWFARFVDKISRRVRARRRSRSNKKKIQRIDENEFFLEYFSRKHRNSAVDR